MGGATVCFNGHSSPTIRQALTLAIATVQASIVEVIAGTSTVQSNQVPRGKPKCLSCEICGQAVLLFFHPTTATTAPTATTTAAIAGMLAKL